MATRGRPPGFARDAVLAKAMLVFWDRGYDGTSIADLTGAMGINPPSLYSAFGSKEALFREAVALYERTENPEAERALTDESTAFEAIAAMLRSHATAYVNPSRPSGCMVVLGATVGVPANAAVRAHLRELRLRAQDAIQHRIECGIADGDVPPQADSALLAMYYTTVLEGLSMQARDGMGEAQLLRIVDCAMASWDSSLAIAARR